MIIANDDSGHLIVASADATADYFLLINPLATVFPNMVEREKLLLTGTGGWVK